MVGRVTHGNGIRVQRAVGTNPRSRVGSHKDTVNIEPLRVCLGGVVADGKVVPLLVVPGKP